MNNKITMKVASEDLSAAFTTNKDGIIRDNTHADTLDGNNNKLSKNGMTLKSKKSKANIIMAGGGTVGIIAGLGCILAGLLIPGAEIGETIFPTIGTSEAAEETYSVLTGDVLTNAEQKNAPIYCIQTPNGTDGARPQAGLNTAGVVFEAVAEAGITRFAAIYQAPTTAIIGPIRSLRTYYLQWDTPFDCTIVHAGGSGDALAAISNGGYKNLDEDYSYMYRGNHGDRLWNNLFTTSAMLSKFSSEHNYNSDKARGFTRMTPAESEKSRIDNLAAEKLDITKPAEGDTSALESAVTSVAIKFGGVASFNVNYSYDATSNKYLRSYETGVPHEVYSCEATDLGEKNPEDVCSLTQMAPSVVIAMVVQESIAADNYHEDITTVGTGDAFVFQNGTAIRGSWRKDSVADQIKFTDAEGEEIRLAPGQTIISAIPGYGSVDF